MNRSIAFASNSTVVKLTIGIALLACLLLLTIRRPAMRLYYDAIDEEVEEPADWEFPFSETP